MSVVFTGLYIDWHGKVVPCCNIRSDAQEHKEYTVEDLSTGRSIFDAHAASGLVDWRWSLSNFDPQPAPCESCRRAVMADDPVARRILTLAKAFL